MRLLLLHGAGMSSWIWERVLPLLDAPAEAIDLPGRQNPAEVTLQQCIDTVVQRVRATEEPCVLVGHSISAQIALAVAATDRSRVTGVVLVGGVVPESGKAFLSTIPFPQRLVLGTIIRRSRNGVMPPKSAIRKGYCNDLDAAATELVLSRAVPEAPRLYLDPVHWEGIPATTFRTYVKLLNDNSVTLKQQERYIERVQATKVESLNTGHMPMLGKPEELARILNSAK